MSAAEALLITQCVQNDFVRPLSAGEPLPNLVHVGRAAADRLCGPTGALIGFLEQAHAVDPDRLAILHIVDSHDVERHKQHLALFRPHCLQGTEGARLVGRTSELAAGRPNTHMIPAGDLNDFEDSSLARVLEVVAPASERPRLRVAVVGVWTDAKVSFLLYDLRTRLRLAQLATCSALTASRSAASHFSALQSFEGVLDVRVFHSPGSLLAWLLPTAHSEAPVASGPRAPLHFVKPAVVPSWWTPEHVAERDRLIAALSAGGPLELTPLGGGFSGAQVFLARAASGPAIVKVAARDEVARENFGNQRVGQLLGDLVPALIGWREGAELAAMQMELAQSRDELSSAPATFQSVSQRDAGEATTDLLAATLEEALDRGLGRLYRVAEKDNGDLLELYGFTDRHGCAPFAESVIRRADDVAHANGFASASALLSGSELAPGWLAPAEFYRGFLPGRSLTREIYPAWVHGDLNLANILLSRRRGEVGPARVWVIDFARLARLPNLTDFAKLENDLAYILLPVGSEEELMRARRLQHARLRTPTLASDLAPFASTPEEVRHARLVDTLRRIASRVDPRGEAAMQDYRLALLRYAAHTLGFDEPSVRQRRLALEACAELGGAVAGAS
jgi:hypothetical protein